MQELRAAGRCDDRKVTIVAGSDEPMSLESCGQCPPCKIGSSAITEHLERIDAGEGDADDLEAIAGWLGHVIDGNRCYLAVEEQVMVASVLRAFPEELTEHIELGRCPRPRSLPMPKLVDLAGGQAVYDDSYWRKQPDWTYAPEDQQLPDQQPPDQQP